MMILYQISFRNIIVWLFSYKRYKRKNDSLYLGKEMVKMIEAEIL